MYLSTYEERESGSMYEEAYDGRNVSKLNLCDEGKATFCFIYHLLFKKILCTVSVSD